jgi:hypothetical protein
MRRIIVARQLSGDLSKINPSLALNQQANALPYNPKLEIERYKLTKPLKRSFSKLAFFPN